MSSFNRYFLEYAFAYLMRYRRKNIFIVIVFSLLVMLLATLFFISSSLEYSLEKKFTRLPDIIIIKQLAGRAVPIDEKLLSTLLSIEGVSDGVSRVYGSYLFQKENYTMHIEGVSPFEVIYDPFVERESQKLTECDGACMLVSSELQNVLRRAAFESYFHFVLPDGRLLKVAIVKRFATKRRPDLHNLAIMDKELAKEIFGYRENEATDIALSVANKNEIETVKRKIALMFPNTEVLSRSDIKKEELGLINYNSGIFLLLFIITFFTFFVIVYDKANGLSSEEKREIGILKAVGWKIEDVLSAKFYEGFLISFFSFTAGITLAFVYVFVFKAPFLEGVVAHETTLHLRDFLLEVHIDFMTLLLLFLLTVPLYIAATLIPAWKIAVIDADEVMR